MAEKLNLVTVKSWICIWCERAQVMNYKVGQGANVLYEFKITY